MDVVQKEVETTHRSVIYQGYLHHSLELAILDILLPVLAAELLDEVLVQPACVLGVRSTVEVGLCSLRRLGQESKL